MNEFLSHIERDKNKKILRKKFIKIHISNILNIISKSFQNSEYTEKLFNVISISAKFHDLGKYTNYFQDYLINGISRQPYHYHSLIGANTVYNILSEDNETEISLISYFIVYHHHSNLDNILKCFDTNSNSHKIQMKNQAKDLISKLNIIEKELEVKFTSGIPKQPIDLFDETERIIFDNPNIQNYFLTNYLFSLLIEADKLDASDTPIYDRKPISANAVDKFIGQIDESKLGKIKTLKKQNDLRNYVRLNVVNQLENKEILNQKIFTLTAPTGIGKTLTSLDFALKLKETIREKENREAQIIYALPFINIIEQGLDVYNKVLPNDVNILAHYQYADVFGKDIKYKKKENDDEKNYNQKLMTLDTWQSDIVITSFVQFFETLIGNRNKLLKKFNHYAGSIIILDEVQTIRLELIPLIGAALFYLAKFLGARIILMTATKPKIFELAFEEILKNERVTEKHKISKELLNDHNEVFKKFSRTRIIPLLEKPLNNEDDFIKVFNEKNVNHV